MDCDGLEADESLLTGEADPVDKRPGDRLLSGSFVVAGRRLLVATGVGGEHTPAGSRRRPAVHACPLGAARWHHAVHQLRHLAGRSRRSALLLTVEPAAQQRPDRHGEGATCTVAGMVTMVPQGLVL